MARNASAAGPSSAAGGVPASEASRRLSDSGSRPRNGISNRVSGSSSSPQAARQRQPAKKRYTQSVCGFFGSALAEGIAVLPAMRTLVAGHIFDDAEHR